MAADRTAIRASRRAVRTARRTDRREWPMRCPARQRSPGLPSVSAAASSSPPKRPRFFRKWIWLLVRCGRVVAAPEGMPGEGRRDQGAGEHQGGRPAEPAGGQHQPGDRTAPPRWPGPASRCRWGCAGRTRSSSGVDPIGDRFRGGHQASGVGEVPRAADHEDAAQHGAGEGPYGLHGSVIPCLRRRHRPATSRCRSIGCCAAPRRLQGPSPMNASQAVTSPRDDAAAAPRGSGRHRRDPPGAGRRLRPPRRGHAARGTASSTSCAPATPGCRTGDGRRVRR